jgi:hypothetical protein
MFLAIRKAPASPRRFKRTDRNPNVFDCAVVSVVCQAFAASTATTAGLVSVNDTGHLRFVSERGGELIEEGPASGTLPGTVHARLKLSASTARTGFTIYARNGTITGHATVHLNTGHGEYASFAGALAVSHGSGHYTHATGTGRLSGTINRATDDVVVQVVGPLRI